MSVYIINYKKEGDGKNHKIMTAVTSRAEYLAYRNTNAQQCNVRQARAGNKSAKMRLVQMNYSLSPALPEREGESILLKGCTQVSATLGMDVDLNRENYGSEEDYKKALAEIPDKVLSKKDELGLLMLERSATKGYHIVFRRRFTDGLADGRVLENQVQNLRWASDLLGVEFDDGAKDITRVFFTTTASEEDLLYLDDEIFKAHPLDASECGDADTPTNQEQPSKTVVTTLPRSGEAEGGASSYRGIPYATIIAKYWELFNDGKEPATGDRNAKTYELCMALRGILDYDQTCMEAVIPRYDGFDTDEWRTTIANALKQPRAGLPWRLRQVLAALRQESRIAATGGTLNTPPPMPAKLPRLLALLTSKVPAMYRAAVSEAVFPALGVHMHGVKFRYWDKTDHEPTFMNVLIAPMSIGKGSIKKPIDYLLAPIKETDKASRLREAEWKRKNPSGKTKAKDPRPTDICIQVLIDNLTDAVFNQRVVDAHENGQRFVYTRVDEIEQLKKVTSRGTVDEVSILIRKAFDNADHGQERVGADSITGIAPLRWNFNASTTIPNGQKFLHSAVNDGTLSRLYLSTIIKDPSTAERPIFGIYDERYAEALTPYIDRLVSATGLIECPKAVKLAEALTAENEERATLYESEAYRILSYRANVIAYLKAMVLYVAHGYKWSREIEDYVRWSEQMDLWCKMRFFGQQLEDEIAAEVTKVNAAPQDLLALLPEEFDYQAFAHLRQQQGRTGDGKSTLRKWKQRGFVEFDDVTQTWHKLRRTK